MLVLRSLSLTLVVLVPVQQLHHVATSNLRWACATRGKPLIMTLAPDFEIMQPYLPTAILTLGVFYLLFFDSGFYAD